jgi:hypothetical protein
MAKISGLKILLCKARWGPEADREFWAAAADTSRNFFRKICNPVTGLSPERANFNGTPLSTGRNQNAPIPVIFGDRYYDGTLYLLNLLQCSGEYKIWKPGKK